MIILKTRLMIYRVVIKISHGPSVFHGYIPLWRCSIHILDFWMVWHASTEYFYIRPDSTNLWWSIFAWLHQCQGAKSKEPLRRRASSAYHFLYTTVFSFDCPLLKVSSTPFGIPFHLPVLYYNDCSIWVNILDPAEVLYAHHHCPLLNTNHT